MPSRLRLNGTQTSSRAAASHRIEGSGWSKPPTISSWKREVGAAAGAVEHDQGEPGRG